MLMSFATAERSILMNGKPSTEKTRYRRRLTLRDVEWQVCTIPTSK